MSIQTDDFAPGRPLAARGTLDARIVSGVPGSPAEEAVERALRPKALADYVGQAKARRVEQAATVFAGVTLRRSLQPEVLLDNLAHPGVQLAALAVAAGAVLLTVARRDAVAYRRIA